VFGLRLPSGVKPAFLLKLPVSFPKLDPARIGVLRQNRRIIRIDVCDPAVCSENLIRIECAIESSDTAPLGRYRALWMKAVRNDRRARS
jgi:hypothetical protein